MTFKGEPKSRSKRGAATYRGSMCKNCGNRTRYVSNGHCTKAGLHNRGTNAQWYADNAAAKKAYQKEYYKKNKKAILAKQKAVRDERALGYMRHKPFGVTWRYHRRNKTALWKKFRAEHGLS